MLQHRLMQTSLSSGAHRSKDFRQQLRCLDEMGAGFGKSTPAITARLKAGSPLIHLRKFPAHHPHNLHAQVGTTPQKLQDDRALQKTEVRRFHCSGSEAVRLRAERCGKAKDASGAQIARKYLLARLRNNGDSDKAGINDEYPATGIALPEYFAALFSTPRGTQRGERIQQLWRELKRPAVLRISDF